VTAADMVLTPMGLRFLGRIIPCAIGKGGLSGKKREGDGATPRGVHRVTGCLFRPDRMARPVPWAVPIGPRDLWSDDAGQADYNYLVQAPYAGSHERLSRADRLYDLVLLTNWNWPKAVPDKGSAIFLHRWRRPGYPTEGCVAMDARDLLWLTRAIRPESRLIVR
jgi:L,D-peptidoglycan transpeptidase YkuD (ErfK/YbiS/YcfS/YnhG family)